MRTILPSLAVPALAALVLLPVGCARQSASRTGPGETPVEITAGDLRGRMQSGRAPVLLDVREAEERAVSTLPGSLHIPLGQVPDRLHTLNRDAEIVVFCRSGRRSGQAVSLMRERGFVRARNLVGGMNAWSRVE